VQLWSPGSSDRYEREAHEASAAVVQGRSFTVRERTTPRVQRWPSFPSLLDFVAEKANAIPGFRMFTIVLGVNPINMGKVDASPANILRAIVEFIPGGYLITRALDAHGILDKVGNWIAPKLKALGGVGSSFKAAIDAFIARTSLASAIKDPGGTWDRAKRIFTDPIDKLIAFAKSVGGAILQMVQDAILKPIAKLAEGTSGWPLLCAVLEKNPITGEKVTRSPETVITGFLVFAGQQDVVDNMKKANSFSKAWGWFQGAMKTLMGFVSQIPGLAIAAIKSLTWSDIIALPSAFRKIAAVFGGFAGKFISWAIDAGWKLLEIVFDAVKPGAIGYVKKTGAALKGILKNPLPFVGNLVKAAKAGFQAFGSNIGKHFVAGLINWLTGALPGVYVPKALSVSEFFKLALSVLGITWASMRVKLVKVLGDKTVGLLEGAFPFVVTLAREGPAAAWEQIKSALSDLKDTVIGGIKDFVIDAVKNKAVPKLVAMFVPGAGFIAAIVSIYDTVMVFVNKISAIAQVVTSFIDSIVAIAGGNITAAAKRVESILAGLLSLAINFLAGFAGLGKVADKVLAIIAKVRTKVDKAIDTAIAWIVDKAKTLFTKLVGKKDTKPQAPDVRTPEQKRRAVADAIAEATRVARHGTRADLQLQLGAIARRFLLRSLRIIDVDASTYRVHGEVNPDGDSDVLQNVMDVRRAVAAIQRRLKAEQSPIEVAVTTEAEARQVIAQVFGSAREFPAPTPGSAFGSARGAQSKAEFDDYCRRALAFHFDVRRYRVAEIKAQLKREIAEEKASRERWRRELDFHAGSAAISEHVVASTKRIGNLESIERDGDRKSAKWIELEDEGLLYGHETVNKDESLHRVHPHVNIAGPVSVKTSTASFTYFVQAVIFVVPRTTPAARR
jgi:hypothetical protein